MEAVGRMERHARALLLETAALAQVTVVNPATFAEQAVSCCQEFARQPTTSRRMGRVERTERLAKALPLETAAPARDIVAKRTLSVDLVARLARGLVAQRTIFLLTVPVVRTEKRAKGLRSETAVLFL